MVYTLTYVEYHAQGTCFSHRALPKDVIARSRNCFCVVSVRILQTSSNMFGVWKRCNYKKRNAEGRYVADEKAVLLSSVERAFGGKDANADLDLQRITRPYSPSSLQCHPLALFGHTWSNYCC